MEKKREIWIDDVKIIACALVVLGHFFQSMTQAGVLQTNYLYQWFNQTIYYFHVPLFFICSGYLYQKINLVDSFNSWFNNITKKALTLGVPYFVFSVATWTLKILFSETINYGNKNSLFETLFLKPASPYWYLYTLFFIFWITPSLNNFKMACVVSLAALLGKAVILTGSETYIYVITSVLQNEVWFVMGMCLCFSAVKPSKKLLSIGILLGIIFLTLSAIVYNFRINIGWLSFLLGIIACIAVITIVAGRDVKRKHGSMISSLSIYTMPIFLMHTLFAAAFRTILFKCSVDSVVAHVIGGMTVSFIGPILAAEIMSKVKMLEFILYPAKYIKLK